MSQAESIVSLDCAIVMGDRGMLGNNVCRFLESTGKYKVIGLNRSNFDAFCDSQSKLEGILEGLVQGQSSRSITLINCIGIIPQAGKDHILNNAMYVRVNAVFPHILSNTCEKLGIKMIHVTTDCVYTGKKGNYNETDEHDETSIYGVTKSKGEPENCTVIRTSIIGEELTTKRSLLEWVKSNRGGKIKGYTNHLWNGVTCLQLAKVIDQLISENLYWTGVRHVFSPNSVSKYELVELINHTYGLGIEVTPYETEETIDKTINTIYEDKSRMLLKIPPLKEQIELMAEDTQEVSI